jgi:hypothetical protein
MSDTKYANKEGRTAAERLRLVFLPFDELLLETPGDRLPCERYHRQHHV